MKIVSGQFHRTNLLITLLQLLRCAQPKSFVCTSTYLCLYRSVLFYYGWLYLVCTIFPWNSCLEGTGSSPVFINFITFSFFGIDDCAVIDEIQMMNDSERGWAWTRALLGLLCFSFFCSLVFINFKKNTLLQRHISRIRTKAKKPPIGIIAAWIT